MEQPIRPKHKKNRRQRQNARYVQQYGQPPPREVSIRACRGTRAPARPPTLNNPPLFPTVTITDNEFAQQVNIQPEHYNDEVAMEPDYYPHKHLPAMMGAIEHHHRHYHYLMPSEEEREAMEYVIDTIDSEQVESVKNQQDDNPDDVGDRAELGIETENQAKDIVGKRLDILEQRLNIRLEHERMVNQLIGLQNTRIERNQNVLLARLADLEGRRDGNILEETGDDEPEKKEEAPDKKEEAESDPNDRGGGKQKGGIKEKFRKIFKA